MYAPLTVGNLLYLAERHSVDLGPLSRHSRTSPHGDLRVVHLDTSCPRLAREDSDAVADRAHMPVDQVGVCPTCTPQATGIRTNWRGLHSAVTRAARALMNREQFIETATLPDLDWLIDWCELGPEEWRKPTPRIGVEDPTTPEEVRLTAAGASLSTLREEVTPKVRELLDSGAGAAMVRRHTGRPEPTHRSAATAWYYVPRRVPRMFTVGRVILTGSPVAAQSSVAFLLVLPADMVSVVGAADGPGRRVDAPLDATPRDLEAALWAYEPGSGVSFAQLVAAAQTA